MSTLSHVLRRGLALALLTMLGACGGPLPVPGDFVELDDDSSYEQRLTTPDGVVLGVRVIDNDAKGDLKFWTRAVENRLRTRAGYALIEARDVKAKDGTAGRQLRFGRDEDNRSYAYWVTLFVTSDDVYVVEAGGLQSAFQAVQGAVEQTIAGIDID